ncbi:putative ripening-related protein 1 [Acorus calamus]|uniref:Ripening-related protein 1 n=1 Tax=Acorus calamus TaxID=4465 RepID=A0AAV9C7P7_ACOCL|nr:putative ripening-related protein 1 [Acorus calamus]
MSQTMTLFAALVLLILSCLNKVSSHSITTTTNNNRNITSPHLQSCHPSGYLRGKSHSCNRDHDSDCCKTGEKYPQYRCSPPVTGASTAATMTINSFAKNGDGGGPSECDNRYHGDGEMVVALSTGWYDKGSRCLNYISISANGRTVRAKVVDECDSVHGCDAEHDYQPPCPNNIVDASPAVWDALDIHGSDVGDYDVTWADE